MTPQFIVQDLLKAGLTRKQIAKRAKITTPSVGNILNGKVTVVHDQTWFGLLYAYSDCVKAAQKRLEATTHEIKHLEDQVDSLRLAEALKVL